MNKYYLTLKVLNNKVTVREERERKAACYALAFPDHFEFTFFVQPEEQL